MMAIPVDIPPRFDDHYIYFDEVSKTPDRNDRETELIARLLGLTPGMAVLDCPCGYGRIANRLAARGCSVVGLDAVPAFLDRARDDAAATGANVDYVLGDMRELPWSDRFDRIVNWFVSFGYFDDATNRHVLEQLRRALRPGGRLLIDHVNAFAMFRWWRPQEDVHLGLEERGKDFRVTQWRFNPTTARAELERVIVRDSVVVKRDVSSARTFLFPELHGWLLDAGFSRVEVFGDNGDPFGANSFQMLVVAHA
jgi:SAM-dependent methyltransferase